MLTSSYPRHCPALRRLIPRLTSPPVPQVFSLARSWKSFRRVLTNMAYTASNSMPFVLLFCLCLFVYAIAGMTLFGDKLTEQDPNTGLMVRLIRPYISNSLPPHSWSC